MKPIGLAAVMTLLDVIDHAPKDATYHISVNHRRGEDGWPDTPMGFIYADRQGKEVDKDHFSELLVGGAIVPQTTGRDLVYVVTEYGFTLYQRIK